MQDNAMVHTANDFMNILMNEWSVSLPNLNSCNFYLRDIKKDRGHVNNPTPLQKLKQNMWQEFCYSKTTKFTVCLETFFQDARTAQKQKVDTLRLYFKLQ